MVMDTAMAMGMGMDTVRMDIIPRKKIFRAKSGKEGKVKCSKGHGAATVDVRPSTE